MNKLNTNSTKKPLKSLLTISAIATLLIASLSLTSNTNAYASIFSDIRNVDDVGQSLECVYCSSRM